MACKASSAVMERRHECNKETKMLKITLIILLVLIATLCGIVLSMQSSSKWSVGEAVRTPERHFENLPDYAFQPNYVNVEGYRIHYVTQLPNAC